MIISFNKLGDILASAIRKITGTAPCPGTCRARIAANERLGLAVLLAQPQTDCPFYPTKVFTP